MLYNFVDKYLMNDFSDLIINNLNDKSPESLTVFDIGCFKGNFSRSLKNKLKKDIKFFLFDPNPNLKIKDFSYHKIAFSDKSGSENYFLNNMSLTPLPFLILIVYDKNLYSYLVFHY